MHHLGAHPLNVQFLPTTWFKDTGQYNALTMLLGHSILKLDWLDLILCTCVCVLLTCLNSFPS